MSFVDDLIQSIDARIQALAGKKVSLEEARAALVTNGLTRPRAHRTSQPRSRRTPPRKPTKTTKASNPTPVRLADQAEQLLASTDGPTTTALAEQAGANHDQVLGLLRDLETARRIRRRGQRRATRWHAITDEDRIQQRAAVLAARSRRRRS